MFTYLPTVRGLEDKCYLIDVASVVAALYRGERCYDVTSLIQDALMIDIYAHAPNTRLDILLH